MSELTREQRLLIQARMAIAIMLGTDEQSSEFSLVNEIDRHLLDQMTVRQFVFAFHDASPVSYAGESIRSRKPFSDAWCKAAALAATKYANQSAEPMED